jgi:DNA polymerase III subunit gamma/tau
MAKSKKPPASPQESPRAGGAEYTVVARRYRPQQFADLIGQEHVASALVNALKIGRVAHAYLFTGARGVGKTSAARILAKALNCEKGPTATPCDQCDSCKAVALGEDVDVMEIDGASNNKVDEARDIRQNVGFRPTRSRNKIYIIDEVHMLSTAAFNALLKTLEEPPLHVKFILATTEVNKIPITILSRCQRFDFAHVGPGQIFEQLRKIVDREGYQADDEALRLIARRAGGSMRDSHSLLDQLIASSTGALTAEQVNAVLGTAGDERVIELASAILDRDPKTALDLLAAWVERGLQVGELIDQMVSYWRTLMLIKCGGPDVRELPATPTQKEAAVKHVEQLNLDAILAGLDVWTAVKGRMRDNAHAQVLLEMAVVRLARMEELLAVGQLASALGQGRIPVPAQVSSTARPSSDPSEATDSAKKNGTVTPGLARSPESSDVELAGYSLSESTLGALWDRINRHASERYPMLASQLKFANLPAIFGPKTLVIRFQSEYNHAYEACDSEENIRRMEEILQRESGQPIKVACELVTAGPEPRPTLTAAAGNPRPIQASDRKKQLMGLPLFRKAGEALGAQIWHVDEDFNPEAPSRTANARPQDTDSDSDEI